MQRDYVNVGLLWFGLTFLGELLLPAWQFFAAPASAEGRIVDEAFTFLTVMAVPVFAFVISVLIYSVFRFRVRGALDEDEAAGAPPLRSSTTVYLVWLLITGLLAVAILIHPGITGLAELRSEAGADLVVQVTAEQWNWTFTYPEHGVTIEKADELVLPAERRVRFEITGTDVLHSFWVPAFRMKIDAVPGQTTVMYVTPTVTGTSNDDFNLRVQCAELCGTGHARMRTRVQVMAADEFEAWIVAQARAQLAQINSGE